MPNAEQALDLHFVIFGFVINSSFDIRASTFHDRCSFVVR